MGATWKRLMAVALALAFSLACQWPMIETDLLVVVINTVVCVTFVAAGVSVSREYADGWWNRAIIVCGICWPMRWIGSWDVGPFPALTGWPIVLISAVGGQAMLMNPGRRLATRLDKTVIALFWVIVPLTQFPLLLTSEPEWAGFKPDAWWPSIWASPHNFAVASDFAMAADILLTGLFLVALIMRVKPMIGLDRIMTVPIYLFSGAFGVIVGATNEMGFISTPVMGWRYAAGTALYICVPLALVASMTFRRLEHATISEVLHEVFAKPQLEIASIEDALRRTLRDSTLRLRAYEPDMITTFDPSHRRLIKEIQAPNGDRVAILDADIGLEHHPSLLSTATHASGVALQNLQLQDDLKAQLVEVRQSRARIGSAALEERRRIERDLHDGIQQRMLAVVARLGLLQREKMPMTVEAIDALSLELRETLEDLRNLSHGILPHELRQFGFRSALESISERLPLAITTNVSDFKSNPDLDATLYFVTCELLSNIVKHADASCVKIDLQNLGDSILLRIADDGVSTEQFTFGSGLLGCDDRVRTLGGEMTIIQQASQLGLAVQVRLPLCG